MIGIANIDGLLDDGRVEHVDGRRGHVGHQVGPLPVPAVGHSRWRVEHLKERRFDFKRTLAGRRTGGGARFHPFHNLKFFQI